MTLELIRAFYFTSLSTTSEVNSSKFLALPQDLEVSAFFQRKLQTSRHSQPADMEKRIFFAWTVTVLLSLFSAKQSSGNFFSSLQFTRDALMDFSRGSQRTVDITLEPKKMIKVVNKTYIFREANSGSKLVMELKANNKTLRPEAFSTIPSEDIKHWFDPSMRKDLPKQLLIASEVSKDGTEEPLIVIPFNKTVVENQTKREVYRPRTSPSNKFVKAINDIELAQTNAYASSVKYSSAALAKLKLVVERAIRSKNYKYARQVT